MSDRRAALPFALALGLSLLLHGVFVLLVSEIPPPSARPTQDVVVVDLTAQPPPPPPRDRPSAETEPRLPETASPPTREAPLPEEPTPPAAPAPGRATAQQAAAPAPSPTASPAGPDGPPRERVRTTDTVGTPLPSAPVTAPPRQAKPGPPSLRALLPTSRDLASFRRPSPPPDPAAGEAREATLGLGEQDERYRSYQDQVKSAIYGAWRVGKALVVAGGSRTVLVRLTIDATGLVQDARVLEGSGNPTLDAEALEAVRRARIPPFPAHWTLERLHLMAQFDYLFR